MSFRKEKAVSRILQLGNMGTKSSSDNAQITLTGL